MTLEARRLATGVTVTCCKQKIPLRGVLALVGGFLVHLTLGTQLTFGNTNPYFVSYIRKHSSPSDLQYIDGIWVQACMLMGQGVTMFLGGILEHACGLRIACLIGSCLLSAGVLATYFSLQYNYLTSVLSYGVMFGLGCGIAYPIPVTCVMRWFPQQRGLVGGVIFAGFGFGSTIFNQIITLYLNPDNISPDLTLGEDIYFTQDEVLDRVPGLFLVLGGTYAVMQLVGILLMVDPLEPPPTTIECSTPNQVRKANDVDSVDIWCTDVDETTTTTNNNRSTPSEADREMDSIDSLAQTELSVQDASIQSGATTTVTDGTPTRPEVEDKPPEMDVHPLKMLKTKNFYLVWALFLFGGMGGVFMASMYKSYGQSFIKDDQFIAVVGSCAAVGNSLGGIFWGSIADKFGFNVAAKSLYALFAAVSFTFVGSEYGLKPYFFIWVCLIMFAISGKFTIMPPAVARMYGNRYMSINYGLLYTSQILTAAASAFMGQLLKDILHYNGLFFLIGGMSCLGFILTFFITTRTPDGKKI